MLLSSIQPAIVILDGSEPPAGLTRAAVRNGWPIHRPQTHRGTTLAIARGRWRVVLIHVPAFDDSTLPIIRNLKASRRCSVIVAVSSAPDEDAEIRARIAGADFFLPATAEADLIERTVLAVLAPPEYSPHTAARPAQPSTAMQPSTDESLQPITGA